MAQMLGARIHERADWIKALPITCGLMLPEKTVTKAIELLGKSLKKKIQN